MITQLCSRHPCSGTLDENGFCDVCGRKSAAAAPLGLPEISTLEVISSSSESLAVASSSTGTQPLVVLPPLDVGDPDALVRSDDECFIAEKHRVCGVCQHPVGRSRAGQPGLTRGFCVMCHTRFSFVPSLRAGDRVGRYEIVGPLAHGGVGWVYLAKDTALDDRRVVLKGLIDTGNVHALEAIVAERRYLTGLDHPNIVRILDFAQHPDPQTGDPAGYLVMEFIGGQTLHKVKQESAAGKHPMTVENIIGYGLALLDALGYLHQRGYLYCDLKPDNVIHGGRRITLIDLGAMRPIDAPRGVIWGARRFRVSDDELRSRGLTVRSDLYSVGTTLQSLFGNSQDDRADRSGEASGAEGIDSFRAVLERAANPDWARRFDSAADLGEQLAGSLRQIKALRGQPLPPSPSRLFAQASDLFDDGLGVVPGISRWTNRPAGGQPGLSAIPLGDGRPSPGWVALHLPSPLIDPRDLAASALTTVSAVDPDRLLEELAKLPRTLETVSWRLRAHLALQQSKMRQSNQDPSGLQPAREDLAEANNLRATGAAGGAHDYWSIPWHSGLLALAEAGLTGDISAAVSHFERVRHALPGELAPMLALAFCAESRGDLARAHRLYHAVWQTDRTLVSAAFGLVRVTIALGHRGRATQILDEVPRLSKHYDAAAIAGVQVRIGQFNELAAPDADDLADADRRLQALTIEEAAKQRLSTLVLHAALEYELAHGDPATQKGLRRKLERSFQLLTRQAADPDQHGTLMDLANTVRPRSLI